MRKGLFLTLIQLHATLATIKTLLDTRSYECVNYILSCTTLQCQMVRKIVQTFSFCSASFPKIHKKSQMIINGKQHTDIRFNCHQNYFSKRVQMKLISQLHFAEYKSRLRRVQISRNTGNGLAKIGTTR